MSDYVDMGKTNQFTLNCGWMLGAIDSDVIRDFLKLYGITESERARLREALKAVGSGFYRKPGATKFCAGAVSGILTDAVSPGFTMFVPMIRIMWGMRRYESFVFSILRQRLSGRRASLHPPLFRQGVG